MKLLPLTIIHNQQSFPYDVLVEYFDYETLSNGKKVIIFRVYVYGTNHYFPSSLQESRLFEHITDDFDDFFKNLPEVKNADDFVQNGLKYINKYFLFVADDVRNWVDQTAKRLYLEHERGQTIIKKINAAKKKQLSTVYGRQQINKKP